MVAVPTKITTVQQLMVIQNGNKTHVSHMYIENGIAPLLYKLYSWGKKSHTMNDDENIVD